MFPSCFSPLLATPYGYSIEASRLGNRNVVEIALSRSAGVIETTPLCRLGNSLVRLG